MYLLRICSLSLLLLTANAQALDYAGYLAAEGRLFTQNPADLDQHGANGAFAFEPEIWHDWDGGNQRVAFKPFFRWDQHDQERTHADIRELKYLRYGDGWEVRVGIDKVFWGVTEAWHLVDIVNQTDLVENPDGEDKLGQPMLKLLLERDWGSLHFFVLPGFRERTYPGRQGRLRSQPPVDTDQAGFEAGNGKNHIDFAVRWSHYIGDWDLGLAHFHGTARAPSLSPGTNKQGRAVLIPYYELIDQTSLDAQYTAGDWLWKFEGIYQSGHGSGNYFAATGGFEYTWVGFRDGDDDLGMLLELMWDERGDKATSPFNHDVFSGLRWTANDAQSSELLAGVIYDWQSDALTFNLEASRRLGQDWKLSVQARGWFGVPAGDGFAAFAQDDYLEVELARYF